jgi:hypothetical protein
VLSLLWRRRRYVQGSATARDAEDHGGEERDEKVDVWETHVEVCFCSVKEKTEEGTHGGAKAFLNPAEVAHPTGAYRTTLSDIYILPLAC